MYFTVLLILTINSGKAATKSSREFAACQCIFCVQCPSALLFYDIIILILLSRTKGLCLCYTFLLGPGRTMMNHSTSNGRLWVFVVRPRVRNRCVRGGVIWKLTVPLLRPLCWHAVPLQRGSGGLSVARVLIWRHVLIWNWVVAMINIDLWLLAGVIRSHFFMVPMLWCSPMAHVIPEYTGSKKQCCQQCGTKKDDN